MQPRPRRFLVQSRHRESWCAWEEAQRPYTDASRHLADILQADLALRFPGSPERIFGGCRARYYVQWEPLRLQSKFRSVSVSDPNQLIADGSPGFYRNRPLCCCIATGRGFNGCPGDKIMPRNLKITLAISRRCCADRFDQFARLGSTNSADYPRGTKTEEQARRELLAPGISTPTDVKVQTKIYWAAGPDKIAPVQVAMALSADPVKRAKQVLSELIENPPTTDQRTIPSDAVLLGLYLLPDGTAIADFTEALATETPSGILSEEMAVDSIRLTLENNLPSLTRLKILIHGQEVDTLAGHIDLTGFFDLNPPASPVPAALAGTAAQRGNKK
jgi:hypothetical protein